MANNPYINKVEYGGNTLIDLTSDTVDAAHLAAGYTAHAASGAPITGVMPVADDYVVEAGTSGIWTYRKWNSGVSEFWGIITHNITGWQSWGSLYEATPKYSASYPANLFIETPRFWATPVAYGGMCGVEIYTGASASSTPDMYLLRPNAGQTNASGSVNFYAKGRWK